MTTTTTTLKLSDTTISQIAKCVQIAILTGTDVVDHLRQLELEENNGTINVTKEYLSIFDGNIEKMLKEAAEAVENNNPEINDGLEQISLFS
jgi:putative ubiquitin-RnfH superfamily antitoxin RatB of RatAB toxin-antitoxin module